jgi:hypothetical protein
LKVFKTIDFKLKTLRKFERNFLQPIPSTTLSFFWPAPFLSGTGLAQLGPAGPPFVSYLASDAAAGEPDFGHRRRIEYLHHPLSVGTDAPASPLHFPKIKWPPRRLFK